MRTLLASAAIAVALAASGCGTPPPTVAYGGASLEERVIVASEGKYAVDNSPGLDQVVTAELGDTMIGRSYSLSTPAVRLLDDIGHVTSNIGMPVRLDMPKGVLRRIGHDTRGVFYATDELVRTYPTLNARAREPGGVYVPNRSGEPALVFWSPRSSGTAFVDRPAVPIALGPAPDMIEVAADNRKKELIYTGVSKNIISILYREYQNDMARPAFSQELKYDLGEGRTIGFKGARFEVVKATNLGITYRVLKHLD